jgi:hypothetical protein
MNLNFKFLDNNKHTWLIITTMPCCQFWKLERFWGKQNGEEFAYQLGFDASFAQIQTTCMKCTWALIYLDTTQLW